jgi:hypothetical protein
MNFSRLALQPKEKTLSDFATSLLSVRFWRWLLPVTLAAVATIAVFRMTVSAQSSGADFTIIVMPDPQNETEFFPQVLNSQTQWIAANRQALNIQMVLTEGDNVNDGASTSQMQNLDAAFRVLDNAGVPYLLAIGNHDYNGFNPKASRNLSGFNQWFGPGRYSGKSYFRGNFPSGSNANSYGVLTINGQQYLFLMLEYRPTSASLDWAESILAANPGKEAMVVDHSFVLKNGKREDLCDNQDMPAGNATGQEVWSRLRKYNVIMVLSGHFTGGSGARRADLADNGSLVNQLFADYQDYSNGGNGWLRIITFHPSSNSISVQTYSPFLDKFMTDGANQFTLSYHNPFPSSGLGTISGKVRQQSGCAVIPGIKVSAGSASTTTAADGTYSLSVAPETYTMTASGSGWNSSSASEKVSDSLDTQMNFYLTGTPSPTPTPTPSPTPVACTAGPGSPSVTICSPTNNATVTSPVHVVAATRDSVTVSFMQIYVDSSAVLTSPGGTLDTSITMAVGTRRLTVQAKDASGVIFKQTIYVTVTN